MIKKTTILPTSRSIRSFLQKHPSESFLDNFITMGEFLNKAVLVQNVSLIDDDTRVVYLLQASNFKNFSKLQIERNFFTFTKNASFIFDFFQELSAERVSIEALQEHDIYAEFEEHITILKELLQRYKAICDEHGVTDKIFIADNFRVNEAYIRSLGTIEIDVEGILTNFELELISECAKITPLFLHVNLSSFTNKMQEKLKYYFGFELQNNSSYKLDITHQKIVEEFILDKLKPISAYAISQRILQCGFVKQKIAEFVSKGIDPSSIAVILPDESMQKHLELFDTKRNLNFAMGKSFENTYLYNKLKSTLEAIESLDVKNKTYLERMGDDLYSELFSIYKKPTEDVALLDLLESFYNYAPTKEEKLFLEKEIYRFSKLQNTLAKLPFSAVLRLFLSRMREMKIDDVGGGKVTVIGVLETRGVSYDGVIVVDFNESYVPKKVQKDMFLNSSLRKHVGLPTPYDREELQKHYYFSLFHKAKECAISYVEDETQSASRFLKEMNSVTYKSVNEEELAEILFEKRFLSKQPQEDIIFEFDFTKVKVSNSLLKTYLTCKRKFYYRYGRYLQDFKIPTDLPNEWEIGEKIHLALKNVYQTKQSYFDEEELYDALVTSLKEVIEPNEVEKFLFDIYKKYFKAFAKNEVQRFKKGYSVVAVEKELQTHFGVLRLSGKIDRIDKYDNSLEVLDYKTGSIKTYSEKTLDGATDFQLEFYYLLALELGDVSQVSFYDIKKAQIVSEKLFEEKLEKLRSILSELQTPQQIEAIRCDDTKWCKNCEYKILCERE